MPRRAFCPRLRVLIETLWNVNINNYDTYNSGMAVLIETLWNVNGRASNQACRAKSVLIETLWNVNEWRNMRSKGCMIGFNRNIVECK